MASVRLWFPSAEQHWVPSSIEKNLPKRLGFLVLVGYIAGMAESCWFFQGGVLASLGLWKDDKQANGCVSLVFSHISESLT